MRLDSLGGGSPAERGIAFNLSQQFLKALTNLHPLSSLLSNDEHYKIAIGNKHIGILNGRHLFLRVLDQANNVIADFHGARHEVGDESQLVMLFEPMKYEYFDHLKPDMDEVIWEGPIADLGEKLRRAVLFAEHVNSDPMRYSILWNNCNRMLQTLLSVIELEGPENPKGWTPGYGDIFDELKTEVMGVASQEKICPEQYAAAFLSYVSAFEIPYKLEIEKLAL